ncbi:MAG: phosphoglycerate kinase, partial [Chloroflexi bacterium]|nr:phosphoglycerate kinase [Chloroflexota bacterium]
MDKRVRDKKSVRDVDVHGQTALVRVDFNVPFKPGTTEISDDSRIRAALPTLCHLLERDCRLVVCSHLGRPKGQVVESLRMSPVSQRLSELLGVQVAQCSEVVGDEARSMASAL